MDRSVFEKVHLLQKKGWWFFEGRNKMVMSLLRRLDACIKTRRILDIGSSEGAFLDFLEGNQLNYVGIDIDDEAIKFCKERGLGDRIKFGDITDIPFPDASFNVVTALDIVEHVEDDVKAMSEISRVLSAEGIALIIVPAYPWLWSKNDEAYHHQRRYSRKAFVQLAYQCDFTIRQWSYFNFFLFPVFVAATVYSNLFPGSVKTSSVLKPLPKPVNYILKQLMKFETWIIAQLGIGFPFGSSIIFVLSKNK
ncbi:MAG: class I SAM-dependent methyltransferase [Bacteroidales bacterium]|nr:class I SAM-dependent methyltransferase [Bacteroidales bacterium]